MTYGRSARKKYAGMLLTVLLTVGVYGSNGEAAELSLSLQESLDRAGEVSHALAGAEAGTRAARSQLSSSRRAAGPTLRWSSTNYSIGGRDYANTNEDARYSNSVEVSVPLYTGGRIENNIKRYRYEVNAADLALERQRQVLRYEVTGAYFDYWTRMYLKDVYQEAVDISDAQLRMLNVQFDEGTISRSEILRADVQRVTNEQSLVAAMGDVEESKQTLLSLLALPADTEVNLTDDLTYVPYEIQLEECEEYAMTHRPDVAAAQYEYFGGMATKEMAKNSYRPAVEAVAAKSIVGEEPFKQDKSEAWQAGLRLEWSLFDNGVTTATVSAADQSAKQLAETLEETKRNARLDVQKAYAQMRAEEEGIAILEKAVQMAKKSYELIEVRYREGVDTVFDLLDSQKKLTETRTSYYLALYRYKYRRAQLEQAMGVPVKIDTAAYVAAEQAGSSPDDACRKADIHGEKYAEKQEKP